MRMMKVLGGVFSDRGVAAADVSALQAQAQMDPLLANLETLLAALWSAGRDGPNFIQMSTSCCHSFASEGDLARKNRSEMPTPWMFSRNLSTQPEGNECRVARSPKSTAQGFEESSPGFTLRAGPSFAPSIGCGNS